MKKHFEVRPPLRRGLIVLGAFGVHTALFLLLHRWLGSSASALVTFPVIAAAWYFGMLGGLVFTLIGTLLNALLLVLVGHPGWDTVFRLGGGITGTIILTVVAVVVGRVGELTRRLSQEISERARAESERGIQADFLSLLNAITRAALEAKDMPALLQTLADRMGELFAADNCHIALWDEASQLPIPAAAHGPLSQVYASLQAGPNEKNLTSSVLEIGHALAIEDIRNTPYLSSSVVSEFPFLRSAFALPLIAVGQKLGTVILAFREFHHFSEDEIARGELAAGLIALTLAKFRAVEQAYQRAEESETLRKAGSVVAATLDPEDAISRILEQLEQVVPHDSASVQLLRDGELEIVGGRGWSDPASVIGLRFPVPGDNPNTIVVQTRQPYLLDEADKFYSAFHQPPHSHIHSWLGVPLIVRNEVTGILAIDSAESHHFTREHVQMATAFADQVAIALENAHLFGSTQKQAKRQALLLQLSADLAGVLDEEDICRRAAHNLHDTLGFDQVSLYLVDEDSGDRILQTGVGLPDQVILERIPPGRGLSERPLLDGQLHYMPDVTKESNYIPGNNGSEVDVPIRIGDEVRGVLIVESARLHAFSQNDCDVINTAANIIDLALTRTELFASEHRQFEELAVLHALAMAMTEAKNVDELLERMTQLIGEKLFPDNFGILLLDETAGVLRLHSTYRLGIHAEQFSVPVGQGITGVVVKTGQARRVADVSKDPDYISVDSRIQSEICVPLKIGGQVFGVINAESAKLNAFTVADERLLTTLAGQLAIGIERLRAEESLRQRAEELAALQATVLEITTPHNLPNVLQTIVEQAAQLLNATSGGLYLCDPERQEVRCVVSYNTPRDYIGTVLKYGQGAAGTVAQTEKPLIIDDYRTWGGRAGAFEKEQPFSAVLSVPMFWHGQVTGVIHVLHNVETRRFTEADLELLSLFANHAASATENARMYEEQQHRLRDLALLHEISKNVSASLDLGEVLNRVVQGAVDAVGADAASINLLLEGGQARMMASVGLSEQFKARTDVRRGGPTMTVIRTRQPLLIPDVTHRPDLVKPIVLKEGIKSFIVLPLPGRERIMGAMFVFWRREHVFSDDEVRLLITFANQAALGIENARLFAEVQNLAITDPLTGLYNRRGLFELGRIEFARTRRFGRPFASMMLDIDHFKRVNDTYGHPVGDQVLQALAKHCQSSVREIDLVGRYGGEEFIFLLPETNIEVAKEIAERLRRTIANMSIPTDKGEVSVMVSLGVAMYDENTLDLETMIARADQAMYVAKHKGRNRIAVNR